MRYIDFSSWQGVLTTLLGLAVFTLIGVGIRVLMMLTVQQRRERINRQISERLKTLIAAYRTLGGSFTGQLTVDPIHFRELRTASQGDGAPHEQRNSDRSRRIRDAVEAALADIILLGTEEHVRLAAKAATEMAAGRPIHTAELTVSLRNYIRDALDLDPIPDEVNILLQGPTRTQGGSGRSKGNGESAGNKGSGAGGISAAGSGGGGMNTTREIDHSGNEQVSQHK